MPLTSITICARPYGRPRLRATTARARDKCLAPISNNQIDNYSLLVRIGAGAHGIMIITAITAPHSPRMDVALERGKAFPLSRDATEVLH